MQLNELPGHTCVLAVCSWQVKEVLQKLAGVSSTPTMALNEAAELLSKHLAVAFVRCVCGVYLYQAHTSVVVQNSDRVLFRSVIAANLVFHSQILPCHVVCCAAS